jgi:GntR family transcriptional repressor for pyruvate dehydrogenase complex
MKKTTGEIHAREAGDEFKSASSILARKLQDAIAEGEIAVGSALPSERVLMSKYNVSRATVREALRVLGAHNLIQVKRGRGGGSFILSATSATVVRSLGEFIIGQNIRYIDLVFARFAIEPAAAAQAAISRTDEKLANLRRMSIDCERNFDDIDKFAEANLNWHRAIAEASGNPLFVAFLTSIWAALRTATAREEFDENIRESVVDVHWRIFEAIRLRDPDAARRRMNRHISAYSEKLSSIDLNARAKEKPPTLDHTAEKSPEILWFATQSLH